VQARNYVSKYKTKSAGFSQYLKIQATEKWVEYMLDITDMNKILMTSDFNTKMDLLEALTIAERKRDYMYRHPNFDFAKATQWYSLVKDSPKVQAPVKKTKRK
jgi:hypothetical protein